LGELLGDPELIKAALSHFEQAAEFDGPFTPQFWNEWGVAAMKFAEFSQEQEPLEFAIEKFETAIELDLTLSEGEYIDPEWLYNYGCAYDFLGDMNEDPLNYERSIALLQKVLEIDPDYLQARYNLAVAYSHLGEVTADIEPLKNACEHFHTLLAQDAEDEMAWNEWGLALINLGLLLCEEAQPGLGSQYFCEAESKLQQAAYLGYNVSFYNLACLCSLRGDYQAAIAYLERAENNAGMPPIEDVMQDIWLDGLRETEQFRVLLTHLLSKYGEGNAASG
jgi:tetratricopeptide (TPR) repeat protein